MRLVDKILGDRVPEFFTTPERDMGIDLVQSLISGDASLLADDHKYLAEIVSNKYCEVDVDKWDYIMRDLFYLRFVEGVAQVNADSFSFFRRGQIKRDAQGVTHIAYPLADLSQLQCFFRTRRDLRKHVYLHPCIEASEVGFCELVKKADAAGFLFNGQRVAEATDQPLEFQHLTDSIMNHLEIWMANNRKLFPDLHEEFVVFKSTINQFTDYLSISETQEAIKIKSPLFFVDGAGDAGELQRIDIPY